MSYADYAWYRDSYKGTRLNKEEFDRFSELASLYADNALFGRLSAGEAVTDQVKNAVCAVAEIWKEEDAEANAVQTAVKSETVDGDSVTYASSGETEAAWNRKKAALFGLYLPPGDPLRGRWT